MGVLLPVGRIAKLRTPRCQVPNSFYPIKIPTMGIDQDLNDVARNTNDTNKLRQLVAKGANLRSTNGAPWNHTPLHQACYHGRLEQARTLLELGAGMNIENMPSNDCGRGGNGKPIDLARGGGTKLLWHFWRVLLRKPPRTPTLQNRLPSPVSSDTTPGLMDCICGTKVARCRARNLYTVTSLKRVSVQVTTGAGCGSIPVSGESAIFR